MDVIEHLIDLATRRKKSDSLIVESISGFDMKTGSWVFPLPYGFHTALGLSFVARVKIVVQDGVKKKVQSKRWVQGGVIYFKEGDSIRSDGAGITLQVEEGQPVGVDEHGELFRGFVRFKVYEHLGGVKVRLLYRCVCTQYEFLEVLICGPALIKAEWSIGDA